MTPPAPTPDLAEASALYQAGRLGEASRVYQRILAHAPQTVEALHGLGLITMDLGQTDRALPLLGQCAMAAPGNGLYRMSFGLALLRHGRPEQAATEFLAAAKSAPQSAEPRLFLARALGALTRWAQAHDVLIGLSQAFPDRADVWSAKGNAERVLLKPADAEKSLRRALMLAPGDPDTLNNLGVVVRSLGRTEEAIGYYREALVRAPDRALVHANLGNALTELGHTAMAEHHLRRAVALDPASYQGHYNLAAYLTREERPDDAIPHYRTAAQLAPQDASIWTNLGVALLDSGDPRGAEEAYRRAIALQPDNSEAHYNLAWVLLLTGQWPEGWREYEWRWKLDNFSSRRRRFTQPLWDGKPLAGTLLLHAEQGLGDAIQFVRFAMQAQPLCTRVVVECPRVLKRLFADFLGPDDVIATGESLPAFAAHAPFMSLPHIFGLTLEKLSPGRPYLKAPPVMPDLELPQHTGRKKIGVVWAGSPDNKIDRRRTIPARLFHDLVSTTDADFVSLQVGPRAGEISDLPAEKIVFTCDGRVRDFSETAVIVSQLDLVVGVDTAVMHLAAAMGKPTWMLVPFMPDYRWLLHRPDTQWYPSIQLFRQEKMENWDNVIGRMAKVLTDSQLIAD
jgi:tetratricopeptide (TPR) repeat protein